MRKSLIALASLSLVAVPPAAVAQPRGGHAPHGGYRSHSSAGAGYNGRAYHGGSYHGGSYHGGGYHGGGYSHGGYWHGGGHYYYPWASFGLGFALGATWPWYWDAPYYGYYPYYSGYYAYPPVYYYPPYGYDNYPPLPPASAFPPPAPNVNPAPAACGTWHWDAVKQVYNWVPC